MLPSILVEMQQLEATLLHTEHHRDLDALERLLAPEFQEVSPVGTRSSRDEVKQWLLQKESTQRWQWADWQVQEISADYCLVRYHAVRIVPQSQSKGAWHCSVWRYDQGLQCWRLAFHQSTKVVG